MDIAWRAEACTVGGGAVFIALAPYRQQLAALEVLPPDAVVKVEGAAIVEEIGQQIPLDFLSLRRPVLRCIELKPRVQPDGFRSVLLTCGFESATAEQYLRRLAGPMGEGPTEPVEAGFVGTRGLPPETEAKFFAGIPGSPLSLGELKVAIGRLLTELGATPCSEQEFG